MSLPPVSPAIIAEANRPPVTIPKDIRTNRDAMRFAADLRRSELRYRRALRSSVANQTATRKAYARKAGK